MAERALIQRLIALEATERGVDPALAVAVAQQESGLNPRATGDGGKSLGLFQLQRAAAIDAGIDPEQRQDIAQNIAGGVEYLRQSLARAKGDVPMGLTYYNKGPSLVAGGDPKYVANVLRHYPKGQQPRGLLQAAAQLVTPSEAEAAPPQASDATEAMRTRLRALEALDAGREQVTQPAATPAMVKLSPQMTDAEIASSLGYDYELIRQSKYYQDGMLQKRVTDPNSQLARTMDSILGGIAMGARSNLAGMNQLTQRGLRIVGLGSDADVALADLATDLATSDYAQNIRQGRTVDPKTGRLPFEVSQMVGGMLVPSPLGMVAGKAVGALGTGAGRVGQGLGMVARGATYGVAGGLEAPVEGARGQNITTAKLGQVGLGAGAGALLGPLAETVITPGVSKVLNAVQNRRAVPLYDEIEALGQRYQTRLSAGDIAGQEAPNLTRQETLLEQAPGIGLAGYRRGQQRESQSAAGQVKATIAAKLQQAEYQDLAQIQRVAAQGGKRGEEAGLLLQEIQQAGDDWTQIIQTSGKVALFGKKLRSDAYYDDVAQLAEPYGASLVPEQALAALDKGIAESQDAIIGDAQTAAALQHMRRNLLEETPAAPGAANTVARPLPLTYEQARAFRSDLGDLTRRDDLIGQKGQRLLAQVKQGLEDDLADFATQVRDPDLQRAAKLADTYYRTQVVPYRDTALARAFAKAQPDEVYGQFIRQATTPDRAMFFYKALEPKGRAAVRLGMVTEAIEKATQPTTNAFSPAKFAQYLERIRGSYGVFFQGADKAEMDGFLQLMRHLPRASAFAENPPTGNRAIAATIGGAVGAGALTFPTETVTAGAVTLLARELFTTQAGKRLLLASASLPPNAARWETVLTRLTELLPQAAGRERAKGVTTRSIESPTRLSIDIEK